MSYAVAGLYEVKMVQGHTELHRDANPVLYGHRTHVHDFERIGYGSYTSTDKIHRMVIHAISFLKSNFDNESPYGGSFCVQRGGTVIKMVPMASTVSDRTLRLVALFCGQEVKDKLLYEGDAHGRSARNAASVFQRGSDVELGDSAHTGVSEAEGRPA
jgi:hypothetical protein